MIRLCDPLVIRVSSAFASGGPSLHERAAPPLIYKIKEDALVFARE
jgi:hypothetical protein